MQLKIVSSQYFEAKKKRVAKNEITLPQNPINIFKAVSDPVRRFAPHVMKCQKMSSREKLERRTLKIHNFLQQASNAVDNVLAHLIL